MLPKYATPINHAHKNCSFHGKVTRNDFMVIIYLIEVHSVLADWNSEFFSFDSQDLNEVFYRLLLLLAEHVELRVISVQTHFYFKFNKKYEFVKNGRCRIHSLVKVRLKTPPIKCNHQLANIHFQMVFV